MSKPQANAKVMVEEEDFERAQALWWNGKRPIPTSAPPDPLPAMQFVPHRVSADDPQIYHPGAGQHSFRAQDFSEGILLRGLPLHLEQRRPSRRGTAFGTGSFPGQEESREANALIGSACDCRRERG